MLETPTIVSPRSQSVCPQPLPGDEAMLVESVG
jgi:hypothetical protein